MDPVNRLSCMGLLILKGTLTPLLITVATLSARRSSPRSSPLTPLSAPAGHGGRWARLNGLKQH
jgi:hypothetical protein